MRRTLVRTEPIMESDFMRTIENELNSSFWKTMNLFSTNLGRWVPAVDAIEYKDTIIFSIDMAGIPEEEINLEYEDGYLTISGTRKSIIDKEVSEEYSKIIHRHELSHGEFSRTFRLPEETKVEDITAEYNLGMLQIIVAKHHIEEQHGYKIPITGEHRTQEITSGESKEKIMVGT